MLFEFNRYSSLLLIFFIHGLVYALLLFRKGIVNETRSDRWLAIFLFLCSLYITPWMVGFAGWYDTQPYRDVLFYIPFQQLYLIGPIVFFYIQSLLNPDFSFKKTDVWHLLPGILYLLYSIIVVVTDKLVLQRYFFLADGADPDFDAWYQVSGLLSMIIYFIISLRYYRLYRKLMLQVTSYAGAISFKWVRNFLLAFLLILIIRACFFIINLIIDGNYWTTWWYFLFFSLIAYYIGITGYANSIQTKIAFKPNLFQFKPALYLPEAPAEEAEYIVLDTPQTASEKSEEMGTWKEKLTRIMEIDKVYEDPELNLAQVAKIMQSNPSFISRIVNQGFGMNFNDFVNQYRIQAVKEMIERKEHLRQNLLGIAYDAGFNSKATFNRAFKKATGDTPRDYIAKLK